MTDKSIQFCIYIEAFILGTLWVNKVKLLILATSLILTLRALFYFAWMMTTMSKIEYILLVQYV